MALLLVALAVAALVLVWRVKGLGFMPKLILSVGVAFGLHWLWPAETFEERVARLTTRDSGPTVGCSASRQAVEEKLKAPASAKWGDCFSTTAGSVQTVTLTVDSQNGFGALIRSQWITTVRDNVVLSVTQVR